jgi:hypothetical protein
MPDRGRSHGGQRQQPARHQRPPAEPRREHPDRPASSAEPWSEVPPEVQELLRAELARRQGQGRAPSAVDDRPSRRPTRQRSCRASRSQLRHRRLRVERDGRVHLPRAQRPLRWRKPRRRHPQRGRQRDAGRRVPPPSRTRRLVRGHRAPKRPSRHRRCNGRHRCGRHGGHRCEARNDSPHYALEGFRARRRG